MRNGKRLYNTKHTNTENEMDDKIYWQLRKMMEEEGAWDGAMQMKVYSTEQYISEFGDGMSDKLKALLRAHVGRMQVYLDNRVLEPISLGVG